jgi:hypothetical protein
VTLLAGSAASMLRFHRASHRKPHREVEGRPWEASDQ